MEVEYGIACKEGGDSLMFSVKDFKRNKWNK